MYARVAVAGLLAAAFLSGSVSAQGVELGTRDLDSNVVMAAPKGKVDVVTCPPFAPLSECVDPWATVDFAGLDGRTDWENLYGLAWVDPGSGGYAVDGQSIAPAWMTLQR